VKEHLLGSPFMADDQFGSLLFDSTVQLLAAVLMGTVVQTGSVISSFFTSLVLLLLTVLRVLEQARKN
jgi:hypothetical protein